MKLKRAMTVFCIFGMIFLIMQCEKQPDAVVSKNPHDKPPDLGKPAIVNEYLEILPGGDIAGQGCYTNWQPFTLTLGEHYGVDAGTFYGDSIRILYSTKKHGENRIDFWYEDGDVRKFFHIRQPNPSNAYDPENRTLTFDDAESIVAIRDGTAENFTDYTPASATVQFSDCE